jgi:hypothetical protein
MQVRCDREEFDEQQTMKDAQIWNATHEQEP